MENGLIMAFIEIVLLLTYTSVLLIKSCDTSSLRRAQLNDLDTVKAMCSTFGFGDTASGGL